jgi:hypothetical protein
VCVCVCACMLWNDDDINYDEHARACVRALVCCIGEIRQVLYPVLSCLLCLCVSWYLALGYSDRTANKE